MEGAGRWPITCTDRAVEGDDQLRNNGCKTDLGAIAADQRAGQQMFVTGPKDGNVRPAFPSRTANSLRMPLLPNCLP